ncbi:MAG: hypothetical protein ABJV86_08300 [Yoonia sp.]|uniref:hypothetical protein n=2 Tax=Yoonia sp. TaxID=2212373 RepID=UPI003296FF90
MMTFAFLRPVMACVMLSGLAACGGGGGSDPVDDVAIPDVPDTTTPDDTSTNGQRASAQALLNTWAPTNPPVYTDLATIPTTGAASYDGYLFGNLSNEADDITDSVIGSLTLTASFTAGGASFTGSADDFVDSEDADLTGSLAVSGGMLDRDGNPASDATVVRVNVAGVLTDTADNALDFGVQLEGDFLGGAYNAIGGNALGGVSVGGVDQNFDGGFIAER